MLALFQAIATGNATAIIDASLPSVDAGCLAIPGAQITLFATFGI